jgi:hypothetical protein
MRGMCLFLRFWSRIEEIVWDSSTVYLKQLLFLPGTSQVFRNPTFM